MEYIIDWFVNDYVGGLLASFVDPKKRVSLVYLLAALVIACCWGMFISRSFSWKVFFGAISCFFSREIWFSTSATTDYLMIIINRAVMSLIAPLLLSRFAATTFCFYFFHEYFGLVPGVFSKSLYWIPVLSYTVVLFLLDDFSRYFVHMLLHRIPLLWSFHKVHHTAEQLTPFTVYRTHPIEGVIFSLRSTMVQAVVVALFVFLFGGKIDLLSIYGVNIFLYFFNLAGANLRHSNVQLSYGGFLEKIFISPAQHQVHHSNACIHKNKNYGSILAIWDWFGKSLWTTSNGMKITFGLSEKDCQNRHSLFAIYLLPFLELGEKIFRVSNSIKSKLENQIFTKQDFKKVASLLLFYLLLGIILTSQSVAKEINIYSHRQPFLINPFLDAFENKTGIKSNVVFSSKGLAQRLLAEGRRSPADVVLTVDISRLSIYADKNLLATIKSELLHKNIPGYLRDKNNRWFGLSKRARIVVASLDRVNANKLKRIEDLAKPEWRGQICTRPGSHVYNRALLASIIAANGERFAEKWAKGLVSNLAQRPQGNDRAQLKAIHHGVCDLAIINSYYFGKIKYSKIPAQRRWVENVRIIFTNQGDRGNHINISGGGVAKYSKNKDLAIKFLEFLSGVEAQKLYAKVNFEFPANPKVELSDELRSWGSFSEDKISIGVIAELTPTAQIIIDRVGW